VVIRGTASLSTIHLQASRIDGTLYSNGGDSKTAALASALDNSHLDMSHEARMARAKEQGFDTSVPLYHGTGNVFDAFSLDRGGEVSGSRAGQMGVSVSYLPEVANEYARRATGGSGDGSSVLPLFAKRGRSAGLTLEGSEKNHEIAATLGHTWDGGYDSVRLKNYTTEGVEKPANIMVLKNPNQLRSVNAAFDPARSNNPNLLAANGGDSKTAALAQAIQRATGQPDALGYYSQLDRVLADLKPTDTVTADTLAKRGVKAAELEARGLKDVLAGPAKVGDLQGRAGRSAVSTLV
jgi:hypothetical protein